MIDLVEILSSTPWLYALFVFVLGLLVGSFLNVVIHRLPIMMEREWKVQAQEILRDASPIPDGTDAQNVTDVAGLARGMHLKDPPATRAEYGDDLLDDAVLAGSVELQATAGATSGVDGSLTSLTSASLATHAAANASAQQEPYNLIVPRSRCPKCNAEITALQNIPIFSWLFLGGKCANCRAPISIRYPIVELITAVLSAAVALRFGWHWQTLFALVFTWALVSLTVIDLDHTLLPDAITLPLLWLGLLLSVFWHADLAPPAPADPTSAILGAVFGYLILWSVYWAFKLATGKEGMGYGDFKLLGALGAWMGWQMLPLVLLLSAATGAVIGIGLILLRGRDKNVPMPFGPYLAIAGWVALMWGPQIAGGYMALSGLGP